MSRNKSRSQVWPVLAILGLWVFLGQGQEAVAYSSYNGIWEANENEEGRILQQHNHLIAFNLDQTLSNILSARETVNYNYRWIQELGTQESVSPGASLAMNSDLFQATFAFNSVKNFNSQSIMADSENASVNWISRWEKKFVPALRLNYDISQSNLDTGERKIDAARQSYGGEIDWNLGLFNTIYSYRRDETKYIAYEMNQDNHLARVSVDRAFMNDRLRVSIGHEYNESRNEQLINFNSGGVANVPVTINGVFAYLDPGPTDLVDNMPVSTIPPSYAVTVLPPGPPDRHCIRLRRDIPSEPIARIIIDIQTSLGPNPLGLGNANWELYSNNDSTLNLANVVWTQVLGVSVVYEDDLINPRFVIVMPPSNAHNLKIVVNNQSGSAVNFTRVQGERVFVGSSGNTLTAVSKSKSNRSNFGLDFKLNSAVAFYYNLLMTTDGANATVTNESESHNSGLRLQNSAGDLRSLLSYSLSRNRYQDVPETETQTYLLSINKVFLPTLSVALGGSHEQSNRDGSRLSNRNRYSFYADARLYPDLNSQLDIIYWEQESYRADVGSSLTDDFRAQFTLSSRFRPSLVVSLVEIYEVQNQDGKENINKNSIGLTGTWQLSDWFSVNASTLKSDSKLVATVYTYSVGVTIGFGAGLVLQTNYTLEEAAIRTQSGMAALRWSYHQNYSWEIGCNYAESEAGGLRNLYKVYGKMSVNFATH